MSENLYIAWCFFCKSYTDHWVASRVCVECLNHNGG